MILKEKNQKQILKIIEPIMDNCLEGSNEGDYNKHTKDFKFISYPFFAPTTNKF